MDIRPDLTFQQGVTNNTKAVFGSTSQITGMSAATKLFKLPHQPCRGVYVILSFVTGHVYPNLITPQLSPSLFESGHGDVFLHLPDVFIFTWSPGYFWLHTMERHTHGLTHREISWRQANGMRKRLTESFHLC